MAPLRLKRLPAHLRSDAAALREQLRSKEAFEIIVELARGGIVKRRANGSIDFFSPVPCPFNYGHIPGSVGGDGDPLDVLLMGSRRPRGYHCRCSVRGVVWFVDAGALDAKVICSQRWVNKPARTMLTAFFSIYAVAKKCLNLSRRRDGVTRFAGLELWR